MPSETKFPAPLAGDLEVIMARVIETYPHIGLYRVIGRGLDTRACTAIPNWCHPIGALVLVQPSESGSAIIVGQFPFQETNDTVVPNIPMAYGSCAGIFSDFYTELDLKTLDSGLYIDNHAPDELPGDFTAPTLFGVGLHSSPFLTAAAAAHTCGMWAFAPDRLLRLHGHQFDMFTALSERRLRIDNDMGVDVEYSTAYPWEACGKYYPVGDPTEPTSATGRGKDLQPARKFTSDAKKDIWRQAQYRAQLGGLERELIIAPLEEGQKPVAVFDAHKGLDGSLTVRSAKSILFQHTRPMPAPEEKYLPEAKDGNTTQNLAEDKTTPDYAWADDCHPGNVADYVAFTVNWSAYAGMLRLDKDWSIPEAAAAAEAVKAPGKLIESGAYFAKLPETTTLQLTPDKQSVYYGGTSTFGLLPDGSFVAQDIWGSSITMSRGHIQISAALDLQLVAGRDVVTLAGRDGIVKAKNHLELTTTEKDIRIKSERSAYLLAGNSGKGGIMLQSFGASSTQDFSGDGEDLVPAGIIFKHHTAEISVTQEHTAIINKLAVTLDAPRYLERTQEKEERTNTVRTIYNNTEKMPELRSLGGHVMRGMLTVGGVITSEGGLFTKGAITGQSIQHDGKGVQTGIAGMNGDGKKLVERMEKVMEDYLKAIKDNFKAHEESVNKFLDKQSERVAQLRTDDQYKIKGFMLPTAPWQNTAGATWPEKKLQGTDTYPYPGSAWNTGKSAIKLPVQLVTADGTPVARGEAYNEKAEAQKGPAASLFTVQPE